MKLVKEWFHQKTLKHQLTEVFQKAGLYVEHETKGGKVPIYPKIHAISEDDERTQYVFTLPNGLDPERIQKRWFCFQQILGRNIKIEGDIKRFILNVYSSKTGLNPYSYSYSQIKSQLSQCKLPIMIGKDEFGNYLIYDMVEQPQLLIAGETGSGKSSMLRVILTTLIQYMPVQKLQLHLGDLKRSEFHFLNKVEHVVGIYKDKKSLAAALLKLRLELEKRGNLLDETELSHIDEYNKTANEPLPYIVVCIDEVALLHGDSNVMDVLDDIAAAGRALGMFLILSMQRPDAEVLNSRVKSNLTVRIAFQAADKINSRIILGTEGAEAIDRPGEMLIKLKKLMRIQAPHLELEKAKKIIKPYKVKEKCKLVLLEEPQQELFGVLDDEAEG
ncbi:cell division protein FtsK [Bacillus manliponensis]|uniref:Cell division protein FtsK n=1 Tax=Bacillus manliponensis TaxID=574376 RepID=A0A073K4C6_9BACI|nr:FtsK/SpoIIIE domain-containing protein [Bacillus manliponensis]KEK17128.1 cell division protein FtsK [Bacillus manliponensis]